MQIHSPLWRSSTQSHVTKYLITNAPSLLRSIHVTQPVPKISELTVIQWSGWLSKESNIMWPLKEAQPDCRLMEVNVQEMLSLVSGSAGPWGESSWRSLFSMCLYWDKSKWGSSWNILKFLQVFESFFLWHIFRSLSHRLFNNDNTTVQRRRKQIFIGGAQGVPNPTNFKNHLLDDGAYTNFYGNLIEK